MKIQQDSTRFNKIQQDSTRFNKSWFTVILLLFFSVAYGQLDISRPISFQTDLQNEIPTYACPYFDYNQWLQEDSIDAANGVYSNRVGKYFIANKSSNSFGVWQTIENYKVWRVRLTSQNAYALKITLSDFILPNYTTLFIYSEDRSQVYGPFTANYNTESQVLPLPLIAGETAIIECVYDATKLDETPVIHIDKVSHIYQNVMNYSGGSHHDEEPTELYDPGCQNDINCSMGEPYQVEKRAVVRFIYDDDVDGKSYFCSGGLLNDTDESTTIPYLLTANHCVNSETEAAGVTIYFNFEKPWCSGFNPRKDYFMCGSKLKATDINPVSTDFTLLELNSRVPSSYQPFYAGWNRDNTPREKVVTIHHPGGNEKKISFDDNGVMINANDIISNGIIGGQNVLMHNAQTVWEVQFTDGGTQGGSSGAPLFDVTNNELPRVIGHHLTGISSNDFDLFGACRNKAFFGMFSVSWDAGSTPNTQLKHWLDVNPTNPNPIEMEGYAPQGWLLTEIGGYPHEWYTGTNPTLQPQSYIQYSGQYNNDRKIHTALKSIVVGAGDQTFYRGTDDKMQMIYFSIPNNKLEHAYLNQNGQKVEGDIVVGDGNQLFYRGSNGHLWTYYWQNGSWHNHQLSINNLNQKVKNKCGSIAIGANNQVFYRGTDDELHTYYFDNGNWYHGLMGNPN
jgi:hypothetical protein